MDESESIVTDPKTVTIVMPEEVIEAVIAEDQKQEEQTQPEKPKELSIRCTVNECVNTFTTVEEFEIHIRKVHLKPQRNEKGQFIEGNIESVGNAGKSCEFCKRPVEIIQKIRLYSEFTKGKVDGKLHMPLLEELCDEDYLDIHTDTLSDWTAHAHDPVLHAELIHIIKTLFMRQKGLLIRRSLGDKNPAGAIFLMKANHGMIETEKRILAGSNEDPVRYDIRIVPKNPPKELDG